jgi:hypothetical protein
MWFISEGLINCNYSSSKTYQQPSTFNYFSHFFCGKIRYFVSNEMSKKSIS